MRKRLSSLPKPVFAIAIAEAEEMALEDKRRSYNERLTADKYHHSYQFNGTVADSTVTQCMKQLAEWERLAGDEKLDIEIVFHSPGGDVIAGMALFDFIRGMIAREHTINTMTIGMAASMAGILLQAGTLRVNGARSMGSYSRGQFRRLWKHGSCGRYRGMGQDDSKTDS